MRASWSVTRRPSGLESAIALVVSKRAARVGICSRPNAKRSSPRTPQAASATSIQDRIIVLDPPGATQSAPIETARQRIRTVRANGLMVRSIRSTGGAGVDFIRGSNPKDRLSRRADSFATGLLLACRPFEVSTALGPIEAKTGRQPQFSTGSRFVMSVGPACLEPLVKAPTLQGSKVLRGQFFIACALVGSRRTGASAAPEGADLVCAVGAVERWMWHAVVK